MMDRSAGRAMPGIFAAVAAAWLLCVVPATAQEAWTREQYTSENGLLQNRVHAMELDPWGGLLIGTEGGLVRFDGENFRQIGMPAPEGLRPSRVLDIIPVPGKGYVVRDAGSRQYLYKDNQISSITSDAPARKPLSRFAGVGSSVQLVVSAMDPDSMLPGKRDWPYSVRMIPLGSGTWCMRTDHELLVYNDTALAERFGIPQGKWSHLFTLDGHAYVLNTEGHAFRMDLEHQTPVPVPVHGFPKVEKKDGQLTWRMYCEASTGKVSIVAAEGVFLVQSTRNGNGLEAVKVPVELPSDCRVGSLTWLPSGDVLAIGTDTKGLFLYRRNTMRTLLCDIGGDGTNNVYFAQAPFGQDGVISSTRGSARLFTAAGCGPGAAPIPGFEESAILLDQDQRYWYGRQDTLYTFDMATREEHMVQAGVRPLCFLEHEGAIHIGTGKGIFRYSEGKLQLTNPLDEHDLAFRPAALCITPDGELWVATCSGVYRARGNGGWQPVEGLGGVCARALAPVDEGVLVGTYGSGAFLAKGSRLWHLPRDDEGFLSHVHAFLPDSAGFLWMSTNQGLFRLRRQDLSAWTRDTTQSIYIAYYGKRSGIRNSEFNGGCSPAFTRTGNGWASFPTMDGLVWFRPEDVQDAYPKEPILLEGTTVDGKTLGTAPEYKLSWDHRDVSITFSLAYWGVKENARLEYTLESDGPGRWIPMIPGQRELRLSALPSGKTLLRIRKVGSAFRDGARPIELLFIVPVPFYRSSWFIILCILAAALIFAAILRLNAARLRRRNLHLEKMVRARTSELMNSNTELRKSLEMKEMLVSIISHDIVTPLRFIARVSNGATKGLQEQDPKRLEDTLHDIARSSDKLHANAQGLLQWIKRQDGRIDLRIRHVAAKPLVDEVLAMEQERALDKGIRLENAVPDDDVLQTDRNVLSIILHNLVANGVNHTAKGHVRVSAAMHASAYHITVADTGNGMPDAALRHALRIQGRGALGAMNEEGERDVQGLGLLIVADLLQLLGGSFVVDSTKGLGTAITVILPCLTKETRNGPATYGLSSEAAK